MIKSVKETRISELSDKELTDRIVNAKNDGDVLKEIAEVNRRKQHVEEPADYS
jgi:hypothetical protein